MMPESYLSEMKKFFEELGIEMSSGTEYIPCEFNFTATLTPTDVPKLGT